MLSCSATNLIWQIETLTMRMPKKIKKKGVHHKNDLSGSCTYYCSMKYKAKIDKNCLFSAIQFHESFLIIFLHASKSKLCQNHFN